MGTKEMSLREVARRKARVILEYYQAEPYKKLGVRNITPIWTNQEAKRYGGKILDRVAMGFVIEIGMKTSDNLFVILPYRKDLLRDVNAVELCRLAGAAISGRIRVEMYETAYPMRNANGRPRPH